MKIKKSNLFSYFEELLGPSFFVGLHGISDNPDFKNEYSDLSKEEKAKNIVSMGLINSRHKSIKSTCRIFGRLSETYKKNKDSYTSWTIPEFEKLLEPILKERKK